jgi:hypothetical protein
MVHSWMEEAKRFGFTPDEVEKAWQDGFQRWSLD